MTRTIQGRTEFGAPISPARPAVFRIDGFNEVPGDWDSPMIEFPGYTRGQFWNGFACPYFPKETADKVAKATRDLDASERRKNGGESEQVMITYDSDTDTFVGRDPHFPGEPYLWGGEDLVTTGGPVHVYSIGAFSWIWSQLKDRSKRCSCVGSDVDCGRTATKGGVCPDCWRGACGHVHAGITGRGKRE
jgi:hypothetical protein